MIAREAVEPPRRTAQLRRTAIAALERFHDGAEVARDLLALLHRGARFGEFGILPGLRRKRPQFGHAMLEPFAVALGFGDGGAGGREFFLGGPPRRMCRRDGAGVGARITGEQGAMPGGREPAAVAR